MAQNLVSMLIVETHKAMHRIDDSCRAKSRRREAEVMEDCKVGALSRRNPSNSQSRTKTEMIGDDSIINKITTPNRQPDPTTLLAYTITGTLNLLVYWTILALRTICVGCLP